MILHPTTTADLEANTRQSRNETAARIRDLRANARLNRDAARTETHAATRAAMIAHAARNEAEARAEAAGSFPRIRTAALAYAAAERLENSADRDEMNARTAAGWAQPILATYRSRHLRALARDLIRHARTLPIG